jgi:hypothetical protein
MSICAGCRTSWERQRGWSRFIRGACRLYYHANSWLTSLTSFSLRALDFVSPSAFIALYLHARRKLYMLAGTIEELRFSLSKLSNVSYSSYHIGIEWHPAICVLGDDKGTACG